VRWKKIVIGALLGGLLGFEGQFFSDYSSWRIPSAYTVHLLVQLSHFPMGRQRDVAGLITQLGVLTWLLQRGDVVPRTILLAAFLGASTALVLERWKPSKSATQTKTALCAPTKPKHAENAGEADNRTVQIEMAQETTVIKTSAKEHVEL
jgi:hypothetical protein